MTKCGKGLLPECEYYTSAGCVSPFNCPYKVEEICINSATTTPDMGIQKYFQGLVRGGVILQEPMNYDAATLKIYIAHLEAENDELKSSLTHANEECLKWHERAQNLLKDSGGSISEYEKKISDLQAENAELRARLEKAVEEVDKVKKIIEPTMYTSFCGFVVRWCTLVEHKELYGTQEAAESKLKELKENV